MVAARLMALVLPSALQQVDAASAWNLDWAAEGSTFFDGWTFVTEDATHGTANYLDRASAVESGVAEAFDSHAILRVGDRTKNTSVGNPKRDSIRLMSEKGYEDFLIVMKFSKVPYGCGLWPAFWLFGQDKPWPESGELDILEWVHDVPQQTSLHTGESNRCKLDKDVILSKYPDMVDLNHEDYDCVTKYAELKTGCAPNNPPVVNGAYFNEKPGVIAVEKTAKYAKIFHIPEAELPADVDSTSPQPEGWDKWIISYYPFAESEARVPDSCPHPEKVMTDQHIILNIELCGDWGSIVWPYSQQCRESPGPAYPGDCVAMNPTTSTTGFDHDCCTQYMMDKDGKFGTDDFLRDNALFNISFLRVFQQTDLEEIVV